MKQKIGGGMIDRVIEKIDILNKNLWWVGPGINAVWMIATYFFMIPTLAPTHSLVLLATGLSGFWAGLFTALLWSTYTVILFPTSWDRMAFIIGNYVAAWFFTWIGRKYIRLGENSRDFIRQIFGNIGVAIASKNALSILDDQANINALHSILGEVDTLLSLPLDKQATQHLQTLRHHAAHVVGKVVPVGCDVDRAGANQAADLTKEAGDWTRRAGNLAESARETAAWSAGGCAAP